MAPSPLSTAAATAARSNPGGGDCVVPPRIRVPITASSPATSPARYTARARGPGGLVATIPAGPASHGRSPGPAAASTALVRARNTPVTAIATTKNIRPVEATRRR